MPQTTQIIPKWAFPHVETHIMDNTFVDDVAPTASSDTNVNEVLAVVSGKGIDNTWVKKSSRESAVSTFGDSNFKLYGQPLMQALNVADQNNTSIWMMRVMPDNATYANSIVSAYYKENTEDNKFQVKLVKKSADAISTLASFKEAFAKKDSESGKDSEGFTQVPLMAVRASGRGIYGNDYSMRIQRNKTYEAEFGVKLYDFEVMNSENSLLKEANYVGAFITSPKYYNDGVTLINDILDEAEVGLAPIDVRVDEDAVEKVYDKYIAFVEKARENLQDKVSNLETAMNDAKAKLPADVISGERVPTEGQEKADYDAYLLAKEEYEKAVFDTEASLEENLPSLDEFDIIYGIYPDSDVKLPFFEVVTETAITDQVIVDFSSAKGLELDNGTENGFDDEGNAKEITDEEIEECYIKAFDGTYDKRILSKNRMALDAIFDANYPVSVKLVLVDLVQTREDCRLYLDTNIIETLSGSNVNKLIETYSVFDDPSISVDINNYEVRDNATGKKCRVTTSYYISERFANHINEGNFYVPMVKSNCQIEGHIKDSLLPIIDDYEVELKDKLYKNRLNYFEPVSDNVFQRATQNTSQLSLSDCIEENNSIILHAFKKAIEKDANEQLYNFADETIRSTFVNTEKARYANWNGVYVESWDLSFATSSYEFNHQIMHLYMSITFRGLNKAVIVEIDLNKRQQASALNS